MSSSSTMNSTGTDAGEDADQSPATSAFDRALPHLVASLYNDGDALDLTEVRTAVQLWKERSLHHTLLTLDQLTSIMASSSSSSTTNTTTATPAILPNELHIEAIERHDRGAKEVLAAVYSLLQRREAQMRSRVDTFVAQLTGIVHDCVAHERAVLVSEQAELLARQQHELSHTRQQLETTELAREALQQRVYVLENDPDTPGGDADLCRSLRATLAQQREQTAELESAMATRVRDQSSWQREVNLLQVMLTRTQDTLRAARTMHARESQQLMQLVHARAAELQRVVGASSQIVDKSGGLGGGDGPIKTYDAYSGRRIQHVGSTDSSCSSSRHGRDGAAAGGQTGSEARVSPVKAVLEGLATKAPSPNKKTRLTAATPSTSPHKHLTGGSLDISCTCDSRLPRSTSHCSDTGKPVTSPRRPGAEKPTTYTQAWGQRHSSSNHHVTSSERADNRWRTLSGAF